MLDLTKALAIVSELQATQRFATSIGSERVQEMETLVLSGDLDLDDYRNAFKDEMERDTTIDEDQLLIVVGMSEDPLSQEECAAVMLVAEHTPFTLVGTDDETEVPITVTDQEREAVNISAAGRRGEAIDAAKKAIQDLELQALFARGNESRELIKRNPCTIMVRLVQDYGGNPFDPKKVCELDGFAVPGTPIKDDDGVKSNNPDEFKMYVTNAKKKVVEKSFWWWNEFADAMPEAQNAIKAMEGLDMADNDPSKAPVEYVKMGEHRRDTERRMQSQRRTYVRTTVKQAKKLRDKMRIIALEFPLCIVGLWSDTVDGKTIVSRTTAPLRIANAADQYAVQSFTVTEFMALNLDRARVKGGTWEAVITSGKREKADPTTPDTTDGVGAVTMENVDTTTAHFATFFDKKDNVTALTKRLRAKPEDSDALLSSFAALYTELRTMFQAPDLRQRARKMEFVWDDAPRTVASTQQKKTA